MKKIAILMAVLVLLASGIAQASVSVNINAMPLGDENGASITANSKTLAVVDKDGDGLAGFGLFNIVAGKSLTAAFDSSDWIITGVADGGSVETWNDSTGTLGYPDMLYSRTYSFDLTDGLAAGQHIYLFWFPGLDSSATSVAAGQKFGVLDLYAIEAGLGNTGSSNMGALPNETGLAGFSNFSLDAGAATAQYVVGVAPEPTTMLLLAAGSGLMALRRRRHAA
jgi:hypothetical protein